MPKTNPIAIQFTLGRNPHILNLKVGWALPTLSAFKKKYELFLAQCQYHSVKPKASYRDAISRV
jgi:hypothetical protein